MNVRVVGWPCALLLLAVAGACSGANGASGAAASVSVTDEPPGATCPGGGKRVTVQNGTSAPTVSYVCNGRDGAAGVDGGAGGAGAPGTSASVTVTDAGVACPAGGKAIVTQVGDAPAVTSYVCNGAEGQGVLLTAEPPGANCAAGGVRLQAGAAAPQFACNGVVGGGVAWEAVSAATVARANRGYVVEGTTHVPVTLPTSAGLSIGDEIDVAGVGSGGFALVAGPGQRIAFGSGLIAAPGTTWVQQEQPLRSWTGVASSADGAKVVAVVASGHPYTSVDAIHSAPWVEREKPDTTRPWAAVASSGDGKSLVAVAGRVFTSPDYGAGWVAHEETAGLTWRAVASSADGSRLVAAAANEPLFVSTTSGETWAKRDVSRNWTAVASSADGARLVAAVGNGRLFTSADHGASWKESENSRSLDWTGVASSADGKKLVAVARGGHVYTSTDAGDHWTDTVLNQPWTCVASSADGRRLVAGTGGGALYTSSDGGATWTARGDLRGNWSAVASSSDGTRLVAASRDGPLLRSDPTPAPAGAAARVTGGYGSRIQLIYTGGDRFLVTGGFGDLYVE